jgi:hypothetical protein
MPIRRIARMILLLKQQENSDKRPLFRTARLPAEVAR